jgi:gliding motility-associated-like protein
VSYRKNGNLVSNNLQSGTTGNIIITSLTAGTYSDISVNLGGCSSLNTGPFTLTESTTAPAVPRASLASPACAGGSLNLLATSVTPGVTYHWSGPNGFTSNQQNPTLANVTATASGKYYVWVQINTCISEKDSLDVLVGNTVTTPITDATLTYCEGQAATQLTATTSPGNTLLWYSTPGGGTGNLVAPIPQTSIAGTATYYVSQKSALGCESNRSAIMVTTNAAPKSSIVSETIRCQNDNVLFSSNVQSQDPVTTLRWNFSNGATAIGPSTNYRFSNPGTYSVQLKVTTTKGCSDSSVQNIQIQPAPTLITSQDINLCRGHSAQLNVQGAASYQWTPMNALSCSTCPTPIATPSASTTYVVEGRNAAGCRAYDTVKISVVQPFKVSVSPNDSICVGSSVNLLATGAPLYQWSPSQGLNNTTISNPVSRPTTTTNYTVVGYDQYNCFTDTARVLIAVGQYPTVDLGPELTLAAGTMHPLKATVTNGPIRRWIWSPTTNLSCTSCPQPTAEIKKDVSYALTVINPYGCAASDTVNIKVFCNEGRVFIPNAFTPDGDGINDILMVRASGITSVKHFRIFNRWGELIFEKSNFQPNNPQLGWDGKIRGIIGGPDVFVYTCEVMCENGATFNYKGNVSIIK